MGLVRGIPTEWSLEDIMEITNVPAGCGEILKLRRLNYKVINNTPTWNIYTQLPSGLIVAALGTPRSNAGQSPDDTSMVTLEILVMWRKTVVFAAYVMGCTLLQAKSAQYVR
ncbi:unnamed protein product [Pieris macdunnoughi]|uniref:Uncharacterized protein n=1 Tax=Pieris macdunnoughi TaxID=345717 RepID=A0A821MB31_9NEOP|nr:unnamed protein product [Pieris macdunnoughi]